MADSKNLPPSAAPMRQSDKLEHEFGEGLGVSPVAYSIKGSILASGLTRTAIFEAIRNGSLTARKAGRRTVILAADLRTFLTSLPRVQRGAARPVDRAA